MTSSLLIGMILAADPPPNWKIAAPTWEVEGPGPERAEDLRDHLGDELGDRGFEIVDPEREADFDYRACNRDPDCLAKVGLQQEVDAVLSVKMRELEDDSVEAQLMIVSTRDARVLARTDASGGDDSQMMRSLDEAAIALEAALELEQPQTPVATVPAWKDEIVRAAEPTGPPPALVPYASSIPSMSLFAVDDPANAWVPAVTGSLFAILGGTQIAGARLQARTDFAQQQLGPVLLPEDAFTRPTRADPQLEERAGWAGLGIGLGALVGAATVYWWGEDAPFRVEPFAGPTGGGMGMSMRW